MSHLSIRARLTLTIVALTAVVGSLAVVAGLRAFEDRIRSRAAEQRYDEVAALADAEFLASVQAIEIDDPEFDDPEFADPEFADEAFELFDEFNGFDTEGLVQEVRFVLFDLAQSGLAGDLFEAFGDDDGHLHVLLFDGLVATIGPDLELDNVGEVDDRDHVVVLQADLLELSAVSFEQFGTGQTEADRELDYIIDEVDDLRLGLLVDITDELLALDGIRTSLWSAAAALVVLAGAATWILTGRALRPVAAITHRVDEITSGTLDGRVPEPGGGDEVGVLAQTMNRMLGRLERADMQRRQFVSDASHELRTPVAVLRSEAEVAGRAPDTTTVTDFAHIVMGETTRLEGLVEDLLTLARTDEAELDRSSTADHIDGGVEVDVDEVVLAEADRTRRLPVDLSQVSAGRIRGRFDDLSRAVGHLLDNAARHGESTIAIGVRTEDGRVRIWVEDDGAGLAAGDRERVFDRFTRLDEARTRDRGGSGLGLAVVAETVESLGGTVTVDGSPLGGARFVLDLPAA